MNMKMDMLVGECMRTGVRTLPMGATVLEAASILKEFKIGSVIITQNKKPLGIVTERDIVHKIVCMGKDAGKTKVDTIMSQPLVTIDSDKTISDAAHMMQKNNIRRLPVMEAGILVGIVSEDDLISVYPGIVDVLEEATKINEPYP